MSSQPIGGFVKGRGRIEELAKQLFVAHATGDVNRVNAHNAESFTRRCLREAEAFWKVADEYFSQPGPDPVPGPAAPENPGHNSAAVPGTPVPDRVVPGQ